MTRKLALEVIKAEYATYGKMTQKATRVYIENRISHKALMQAIGGRHLL